jgi:1-acyl-sn-glycerol-3-phosphate acyltransferase
VLDVPTLRGLDPHPVMWFQRACGALARGMMRWPHPVELVVEGWERVPGGRAIFAMNHTQKYDFLMLRLPAFARGRLPLTWIKARAWNDPGMVHFLGRTGNIALGSRGYVLAADFARVHGRRPSEAEYRTLRDALNDGARLPTGSPWDALEGTPREILGRPFDPAQSAWAEAVEATFQAMMAATLEHSRRALALGHDLHIYPQGGVSSRLTRGRTGVIQAAAGLGLPIVPVGCSGCREAFVGNGLRFQGGRVVVRFGDPMEVDLAGVDQRFVPFDRRSEVLARGALEAQTEALMGRINALLEPAYQGSSEVQSDGSQGLSRFF